MTDDEGSEIAEAFERLAEFFASDSLDDALPESSERTESERAVDLDSPETYDAHIWYPTVEDVLAIHDEVIETGGEPGIGDADRLEFVITQIRGGPAGHGPRTIPEKSFALMRYLAANHYFVDGNKRTALATTEVFPNFNGVELRYGDEMRAFLKQLASDESSVETEDGIDFLRDRMETEVGKLSPQAAFAFLLREVGSNPDWSDHKD